MPFTQTGSYRDEQARTCHSRIIAASHAYAYACARTHHVVLVAAVSALQHGAAVQLCGIRCPPSTHMRLRHMTG